MQLVNGTQTNMTKKEALKVLHLASSADAEMITQTYWHLARKAQGDPESEENRQRLDELNEAYYSLHPAPEIEPAQDTARTAPTAAEPDEDIFGEVVAWFRKIVDQTIVRWRGFVPEITALTITTLVLAVLALSAGASLIWTFLAVGVALVTIVAPWRKV